MHEITNSQTRSSQPSGNPSSENSPGKLPWYNIPWHPFLISLLPLAIILAQNSGEIPPLDAARSALLSLTAVGLVYLLFFITTRDWHRAAISATLLIAYFHTAGRLISGNVMPPLHRILAGIGGLGPILIFSFLVLFVLLALARLSRLFSEISLLLNIASFSLLLTFSGTVILNDWKILKPRDSALPTSPAFESGLRPDIYYILLDGYGRQDVLRDLYQADSFPLHQFLQEQGFQIIADASSNYMQTSLSVSSSLNMNYLQEMLDFQELASQDRLQLINLIRHNLVSEQLRQRGYSTIVIDSGYRPTEAVAADAHIQYGGLETNIFERLIVENSALRIFRNLPSPPEWILYPGYGRHRSRVQFTLDQLTQLASEDAGNRFIFAHLLLPHPPFVFQADGELHQPSYPYVLLDGDAFPGDQQQYRRLYDSQRLYLDSELVKTLEYMLRNGGRDAVIILQADHGPGSDLVWGSIEETNLRERFGILMAYRQPDDHQALNAEPKTPVNLFRVLFNSLFNADLRILPDVSYYSGWDQPLQFQIVDSEQLKPLE